MGYGHVLQDARHDLDLVVRAHPVLAHVALELGLLEVAGALVGTARADSNGPKLDATAPGASSGTNSSAEGTASGSDFEPSMPDSTRAAGEMSLSLCTNACKNS